MSKTAFVDTNILMSYSDKIFEKYDKVIIPGVVLEELDKHKISSDPNKQYQARQATRIIEANEDKVEYVIKEGSASLPIYFGRDSNDNRIISVLKDLCFKDDNILALSNDMLFRQKCKLLGLPCEKFKDDSLDDVYKGYKEVNLNEYELSGFYQCPTNKWDLLDNEYLIIKDADGNIIDKQRWTKDKGFIPINARTLKSVYFGDTKPRDVYQMLAIDSLNNSDFTLLCGISGSAKTLLSLAWIMQNIQNGKIGKAVIIFNSVPLKYNKEQGFYPGDRNQKLLQSSLGGILSSKFGDMTIVESLISQGKLLLIPSSEIRGIEIADSDVIYVTEAQNTDRYTMKTIIQRAKGKLIIEGDIFEQQDIMNCNPKNNGMLRAIEIFKGSKYFTCVKLKNRYRHPMGDLADKM